MGGLHTVTSADIMVQGIHLDSALHTERSVGECGQDNHFKAV